MAIETTNNSTVCSTTCSDQQQRNMKNTTLSALCEGNHHRWPVDSPHKGPVIQKAFPCHDVTLDSRDLRYLWLCLTLHSQRCGLLTKATEIWWNQHEGLRSFADDCVPGGMRDVDRDLEEDKDEAVVEDNDGNRAGIRTNHCVWHDDYTVACFTKGVNSS